MCTERVVSTARHYHMVQKTHIEELRSLGHALREGHVLLAGFGASRGVVMHQDNLHGQQLQCPAYHHLAIYHRSLHTALAYAHTLQYLTRRCEVQRPALLILQAAKHRLHDAHHIAIRAHHILHRDFGHGYPTAQLRSSKQSIGTHGTHTRRHAQARELYLSKAHKRATRLLEHLLGHTLCGIVVGIFRQRNCHKLLIRECLSKILARPVSFASIKDCKYVSALIPEEGLRIAINITLSEAKLRVNVERCDNQQTVLKLRAEIR